MRKSRYTVACTDVRGEHLLYNTAYGTFAVLDDEAFASYETCKGAYADVLEADCFLTELSAEEELEAQKALFEAACADTRELFLVLAPTYACNLRCPYCYEIGHNTIKGKMTGEIMDRILNFVAARYGANPFSTMRVQWYGGDPSLALDIVESLSKRLIAWCDERGVDFCAMMLSNCNCIDEDAIGVLVRSRISSVYMTIDGFEQTNNARRVSATGLNSFEQNMQAARLFVQHGIEVRANMNVDKVNWHEFHPLRAMLREELGIDLTCGRLCDYGHTFGTGDFKRPAFDLFDHDEFSQLTHDEFAAGGYGANDLRDLLSPVPRFCNGQRRNYFVIDAIGDVYLCDGYIGERDHAVFNIADEPDEALLNRVSHDPYASAQCRACPLLPICQGNCDWERKATGMTCHPLLKTLPDYLRDYRACFTRANTAYQRLA